MCAGAVLALALSGCAGAQHPLAAITAAPPRPAVVTIGDSIMKGHGLTAAEAWPALLGAKDGVSLNNLACDGAGFLSVGTDTDCTDTFAALVDKTIKLAPRTVIIEGSSNDFGEDDKALYQVTVSEVKEIHRVLPNARIIGLSTVWNETTPPAQLASVNQQVARAVKDAGGTYLNIGQPLAGHPEWMQKDDVHPTAAGQVAIFTAVKDALADAKISLG